MGEVIRYSEVFKQQVLRELEEGKEELSGWAPEFSTGIAAVMLNGCRRVAIRGLAGYVLAE